MRDLPSLTGLRAFEAAAQCGSFVQAGEELGVSSAAVSLQVRHLEEHLGKKLFQRQGNRIHLTDAGSELFPRLAGAFDEMAEAVQGLRQNRSPRQLVVSVIPSLANCWLMPRVAGFSDAAGAVLDIRVQEDPIDFVRDGVDVRLTYQSTYYSAMQERELFKDVAVPVCSPAFWQEFGDADGLLVNIPARKLIETNWGASYSSGPSWRDWFREAGRAVDGLGASSVVVSDLSVAITAALHGAGVALVPRSFVEGHIGSGALVRPSSVSIAMAKPYVCVFPKVRAEYSVLRAFFEGFVRRRLRSGPRRGV
ncbi:MAG: LysR family transcriptional regulator [Boseongicola sp.]|nr:MAG: LysR family transcriptional regulator [Boseongicola sp.]